LILSQEVYALDQYKTSASMEEGDTTSRDDNRVGFDRLGDHTLRNMFEFVGPCYSCLALTCRKFHEILGQEECIPCCERPCVCHPTGEWILPGPRSEYMWSCCQGSVNDPGCVEDDYCQEENDRERERHQERLNYEGGSSFPVDSLKWCERHCRCGYNDGVHAYCKKDSLKAAHPTDFDSHSDTESSSGRKTEDHDTDGSSESECDPISSVCCPYFELGDFLESEDDDGDASGLILY
jgi:hypothetical protein